MTERLNAYKVVPNGIAALRGVEAYLAESGLDPKLVALVKIRASQINGCTYCLHMHNDEARKAGENQARLDVVAGWEESRMFTARERAALAWTEALTHISRTHAPDDVFAELKRHFSEKEMADLSIAIGTINLWNRLAISTRQVHPGDKPAAD